MNTSNSSERRRLDAIRRTSQYLIPVLHPETPPGEYDIYPAHDIGPGRIEIGYPTLARRIAQEETVIIDGYLGVDWPDLRSNLDAHLRVLGIVAQWVDVADAMLPPESIERIVAPYLGGNDPLFGTRFTGTLRDFFNPAKLAALRPDPAATLAIIHGCGAALARWEGHLVYIDIPKNEIQFRSRAGVVRNLGCAAPNPDPKEQYKRFYFVDWVALNAHKESILPRIDLIVDAQRPANPVYTTGTTLRGALHRLARTCFRVRPWFEPGPWGGQWIRERIPGLAPAVPNYAWSFELIVPENGILLSSDRVLLEVSFDFLMFHDNRAVLGDCADRFRYEFPIRFDFLDTFEGGNLSLQCHPRRPYIRRHFGESFTQDETYYILDCRPGAEVYLGFREGIDPDAFRSELEDSHANARPADVERFVNREPAQKHDLFLIPNGTIHCSGTNNLVLEISATPYIFTFKMYDWMRLDLDGRPRPLNIKRAFENLDFTRAGEVVKRELVSRPLLIEESPNARVLHLPTHREHFYDIHRLEFTTHLDLATDGSPHVLSLVEGRTVTLQLAGGKQHRFNYAETFVVPAATGQYRLLSHDGSPLTVLKAFMKPLGQTVPGAWPP